MHKPITVLTGTALLGGSIKQSVLTALLGGKGSKPCKRGGRQFSMQALSCALIRTERSPAWDLLPLHQRPPPGRTPERLCNQYRAKQPCPAHCGTVHPGLELHPATRHPCLCTRPPAVPHSCLEQRHAAPPKLWAPHVAEIQGGRQGRMHPLIKDGQLRAASPSTELRPPGLNTAPATWIERLRWTRCRLLAESTQSTILPPCLSRYFGVTH